MPLAERVEGRYAHQPVHSLFGLQVAVGVIALYLEGYVLYARLVPRQIVQLPDGPAPVLAVSGVHSVQYGYPVLSLCSAGARMEGQYGVEPVIRALQQRFELQRLYLAFKMGHILYELVRYLLIVALLRHVRHYLGVLQQAPELVVLFQLGRDGFHALVGFIGRLNVIPEIRCAHLLFQFLLFGR